MITGFWLKGKEETAYRKMGKPVKIENTSTTEWERR